MNIRLVNWVDSVVAAQVGPLVAVGRVPRSTHAHIHLLLDAVGDAVITLVNIIRINTIVSNLWTQRVAIGTSS